MTAHREKLITREMIDCFRRDINSGHPVFATRAIKVLKEIIEGRANFDCEATRLNAVNLYSSLAVRQ